MKPKATVRKVRKGKHKDQWRYERPTFGFSRFDVERAHFGTWREAFRFATGRHTTAGDGARIEQAFEGSDGISPVPRWTPLEPLRFDDKGAHDA